MAEPKERVQWTVRATTPDDANRASELLRTCYHAVLPRKYDAAFLLEALLHICTAKEELLTGGTWYVVEHPDDGHFVGCGGWTAHPPGGSDWKPGFDLDRSLPHLRYFAVHPDFLHKGIGSALWNRCWKDMEERLGPSPVVEVFSSLTGRPFYESLGFEYLRETVQRIGGGRDLPCIHMRRDPK